MNKVFGVTGHREFDVDTTLARVDRWVVGLPERSVIYHGCCIGVDELVAERGSHYGHVVIAVIPAALMFVSRDGMNNSSGRIFTPPGKEEYRERNKLLVEQLYRRHGTLVAFWNGNKRSGTSMTINIARNRGVPVEIERI